MKPLMFATSALFVLHGVASLAQQPQQHEPAHNVYVLTGCLESGPAPASGFKLVDAMPIGQAPPTDRPKKEADAAAGSPSYDVFPVTSVSEQGVNRETLESHTGSRVEITVRPVEPSIAPSTTTRTPDTTAAKVEQSTPRRYMVVKIGKVPGSCG